MPIKNHTRPVQRKRRLAFPGLDGFHQRQLPSLCILHEQTHAETASNTETRRLNEMRIGAAPSVPTLRPEPSVGAHKRLRRGCCIGQWGSLFFCIVLSEYIPDEHTGWVFGLSSI